MTQPDNNNDSNNANPPLITGTANGGHGKKVDHQALYQSLISGLLQHYQPEDVFYLKGKALERDELIAELQAFVAAAEKSKAENQSWRNSVQAERALEKQVRPLRLGMRGVVQARFGKDGAQVLQFGFAMVKPPKRTAETKAKAVEQAEATRTARGTRGKKQKAIVRPRVAGFEPIVLRAVA